MRKTFIGLFATSAMLASGIAFAQQPATTPAPGATAPVPKVAVAIPKGVFVKGQAPGQFLAKDRLIGAKVHNKDGAIIGDIEDLIVAGNNQIVGVIMGTGGFLGAGEKKVGVQLGALQFTQKDGKQYVSLPFATKEVLAALEPYKRAEARKTLIERGKEKAQELTDKTKETAKDAAVVVKEKAGPAYEKAKESAGAAIDRAKEAVKPAEEKK
jgi:ribosomal 30S subunit maturation factor RimM